METYTFQPKLEKIRKKIHQEKISFIPGKIELSNSSINSFFYIFSKERCSYISGNGNSEKTSYIFSKESFSYISGKGKPEKNFLYFRKRNLLIFQERYI